MHSGFSDPRNHRFIITGGPGFGKSTLIDELEQKGFQVYKDVARKLIQSGMEAPIWSEESRKGSFFRQIFKDRLTDYLDCVPPKIGFFDRGLPDSIAFTRHMGLQPAESVLDAIRASPYNPNIFLTPVWPEIFTNDEIRKEDVKKAAILDAHIREVYGELGYRIIELPKSDLQTRVDFILDKISNLLGYKVIDNISLLE